MATPTSPGDIGGLRIARLGKITGISMTATAVFDWYNNGQATVLATHFILHTFSDFPDGTSTPATWAFSIGTDSATVPVNMRAAASATNASTVVPIVAAFVLGSTTLTQYIPPRTTCYFAVTTTTNGVGTFDATLYGGYLDRKF
jgi:hypothetical protein